MTAAPVVIGGLLAATGIVGAVVMFSFTAWHITQRIEETFPAPLTEQLSLSNFNGNVTYEPHDGQDILIEALVRAAAPGKTLTERIGRQVSVVLTHEEGELRVEGRQRPGWGLLGHAEVNFTVRVPRHWEGTVIKTVDGEVQLPAGASVSESDAHRVVGRLGDGRARLTVRTSGGSVFIDLERLGDGD